MKWRTSTLTKVSAFMFAFFLITAGCEREEFQAPLILEIHFSAQQANTAKSGNVQKSAQFMSTKGQIIDLKSTNGSKAAIASGASYTIYGTGVTGVWTTEPPTAISWQITNTAIGLDTTLTSRELITFTFEQLGVYTIRAFNPPPYGFEWFMTVSVLNSLDEALIVNPDFIGSEYISSANVFRYYWRVPRPSIFDGTETLFRLFGYSGQVYDPFPAFYDQVSFYGSDSIEWYYDLPPNGLTAIDAKTNAGYVNSLSVEIWLTIDTASIWRCQDLVDNNIIEASHYNGQAGPIGSNFSPPAGTQTGAGDHGREIPVVLIGTPIAGAIPLYILSSPQTNMWRHRLISESTWTEVTTTPQNGRINIVLPAHPSFDQRIVQYGHMDNGNFIPDPYMALSSMYNTSTQGFSFAY